MPSSSTPLRFGVLGGANIAKQFVRDVAQSPLVRVDAVASRRPEASQAFASSQGIGRHHGSYEALLADPQIDAIYLPLPNSLHAEWAIKAAEAGKHVLCEKPLALSRAEAEAMFDAARRHRVMLLESFPYWFQPQTGALVGLLQSGAIGDVRLVQASFGFRLLAPEGNIRMDPALGGGALLDAGSYPLSLVRLAMGRAPQRVQADARWSAQGVDMGMNATLHYEDGACAQVSCAMDVAMHRAALIVGTEGVIETEYLNHTAAQAGAHPFGWLPSRLRVRRGVAGSIPFEDVPAATGSGFRFAAEAFAKLVETRDFDAFERAAASSVDQAATLEALARSAKEGRAVTLRA